MTIVKKYRNSLMNYNSMNFGTFYYIIPIDKIGFIEYTLV